MSAVQDDISLTGSSFISGHIYYWFISDSEGKNAAKLIALITSCYSLHFPEKLPNQTYWPNSL